MRTRIGLAQALVRRKSVSAIFCVLWQRSLWGIHGLLLPRYGTFLLLLVVPKSRFFPRCVMASISSDEMLTEQQHVTGVEQIQESMQELQKEYEKGHREHIQAMSNMEKQMSVVHDKTVQMETEQSILEKSQEIIENTVTTIREEQRTTVKRMQEERKNTEGQIKRLWDALQKHIENTEQYANGIAKDRKVAISSINLLNQRVTQLENKADKEDTDANTMETRVKAMAKQIKDGKALMEKVLTHMNNMDTTPQQQQQSTPHEQQRHQQHTVHDQQDHQQQQHHQSPHDQQPSHYQQPQQSPHDQRPSHDQQSPNYHQHQHQHRMQHQHQQQHQHHPSITAAAPAAAATAATIGTLWDVRTTPQGDSRLQRPGVPYSITPTPTPEQVPAAAQQRQHQHQHHHQYQQCQQHHYHQHQYHHSPTRQWQHCDVNYSYGVTWKKERSCSYDFGLPLTTVCGNFYSANDATTSNNARYDQHAACGNQHYHGWNAGENTRNLVDKKTAVKPDTFDGKMPNSLIGLRKW